MLDRIIQFSLSQRLLIGLLALLLIGLGGDALRKISIQIGQRGAHRFVKTARVDIPKRVRREVAEQAYGPMHILQNTVRRFVDRKAKVGHETVVPRSL